MPGSETDAGHHVVLVGMMGSGKTSVGEALARRLGRDVADTDHLVELATKKTVRAVFAEHGEAEFRRLEGVLLHHALRTAEPGVIGCGGGVVTQAGNRAMLAASDAVVVWLRARPETLVARLEGAGDRPLLDGDPEAAIRRLAGERAPWYAEVADVTVDVDDRGVDEIVDEIVDRTGEAVAR